MDKKDDQYCSLFAAAAGEPLIGSAGKTDVFFLLEYDGPWEDKAFEKSNIPEQVKQYLGGFSKSLPASKVQVIKPGVPGQQKPIRFFVVLADDQKPLLYRFNLDSYEGVLDLDLAALVRKDERFEASLQFDPLYLVCTNGRRDLCCARFGTPLFNGLKSRLGDAVWQCSHIGGHRFAPNFFHMPYGLLYGRILLDRLGGFIETVKANQVALENLRGRSVYSAPAQAAELTLRQQNGDLHVLDYHLERETELEPGLWQVYFTAPATGQECSLKVRVQESASKVYESCQFDKQTNIVEYMVV